MQRLLNLRISTSRLCDPTASLHGLDEGANSICSLLPGSRPTYSILCSELRPIKVGSKQICMQPLRVPPHDGITSERRRARNTHQPFYYNIFHLIYKNRSKCTSIYSITNSTYVGTKVLQASQSLHHNLQDSASRNLLHYVCTKTQSGRPTEP